ncbi:MAG: hypothetical protein HYW90_01520 [Candidatus Sungbacteria bacterium]|nr:hypothetical protein [Candidatus Sungbacteria bacterium]
MQELGIAEKFLISGNTDIANEHIERSTSYQRLWHLYDSAALEVWSRNIEKAQEIEHEIGKLSASIPGLAGKAAGGKFGSTLMGAESMLLNYWLDSQFKSVSTADRNAAKDVIVSKVAEAISEEVGLKVSATKLAFGLVELNKLVKTGVSAPEEIAKLIANELEHHEIAKESTQIVTRPATETKQKEDEQPQKNQQPPATQQLSSIAVQGKTVNLRYKTYCDRGADNTGAVPTVILEWNLDSIPAGDLIASQTIYRDGKEIHSLSSMNGTEYGDGTIVTGKTYEYVLKVEHYNARDFSSHTIVSDGVKVAVPQDVCAPINPYVGVKANGNDGPIMVSSFPSTTEIKWDIDNALYVSNFCSHFNINSYGSTFDYLPEPSFSSVRGNHTSFNLIHDEQIPNHYLFGVICLTKEENERRSEVVNHEKRDDRGMTKFSHTEISDENITIETLARLLSNQWINLDDDPVIIPKNDLLKKIKKFKTRADAVEILFQPAHQPSNVVVKEFKLCVNSVAKGGFLRFQSASAGFQQDEVAALILSRDNTLGFDDIVLNMTISLNNLNYFFKTSCEPHINGVFIPESISSGEYFIGLLLRDGRQITVPLTIE